MPAGGNDALKKLLIKLNISTKEWKAAVDEIKRPLKEMQEQAKKDMAEQKKAQKDVLDLTKQQIADQKRLQAEARTMIEVDKAKAQWEERTQAAIKTKIAQRALETTELKKQSLEQQAQIKLEQQQLQLAAQRLRLSQQQAAAEERKTKAEARGGEGGGGILGTVGRIVGTAFGGGAIGTIAGGVFGGTLLSEATIKLVEKMAEKVHELGESFLHATGPAAQLREQFEKLTKRSGEDPEEYLGKLRAATRGLAQDTDLYRIANNFLQQGIKVSNADIVKLVGTTLDLARAQGRTAPEAMQALIRASLTGRTMTLAMVTGLDRQSLSLRGVSQAMDATTRNTLQFNQVLQAMEARLKAVGTPATTLPELLTKWENIQHNLVDDLAFAATRTNGFRQGIANVSKALDDMLTKMTPVVIKLGEFLGPVLGASMTAAMQAMRSLGEIAGETAHAVERVFEAFGKHTGDNDYLSNTVTRLTTIKGLMLTLYNIWQFIEITAKKTVVDLEQIGSDLAAYAHPLSAFKTVQENALHAQNQYGQIDLQAYRDKADFTKSLNATGGSLVGTAGPHRNAPDNQLQLQKQLAQLDVQIAKQVAQQKYEIEMERLKGLEALNKQYYESGLIDLKQEVEKEKAIYQQEYQAKVDQLESERQQKLKELATEAKSGTPREVIAKKRQLIDAETAAAVEKAQEELNQKLLASTNQLLEDQTAAYKTYVDSLTKINKEGVDMRSKQLEDEFKHGEVSAKDYINQKKSLIIQEYDLTVTALNQRMALEKDNAQARAKLEIDLIQAQIDKEKQLTDLMEKEDDLRYQSIQGRYTQAKGYLQGRLNVEASTPGVLPGTTTADNKALLDITEQYLHNLQDEQATLEQEGKKYSDDWVRIQDAISQATVEQNNLNTKLREAHDTAGSLASLFETIAGFGNSSKGIGKFFADLSRELKQLSDVQKAFSAQGGGVASFNNLAQGIKGLFTGAKTAGDHAKTAMEIFQQSLKKGKDTVDTSTTGFQSALNKADSSTDSFKGTIDTARTKVTDFASAAQEAAAKLRAISEDQQGQNNVDGGQSPQVPTIDTPTTGDVTDNASSKDTGKPASAISQFVGELNALTKATKDQTDSSGNFADQLNAVIGTVQNFASGLQSVIKAITGSQSTAGGIASGGLAGLQFGANFGPIGAVVGGAVGAIFGGIFGSKNAGIAKDIRNLKEQMQAIVDQLQEGTISLGSAINQLRQERQAAIQLLGGSKKGGKQLPGVLGEIDAEIQKLVDQQKQTLDDLHQQLLVLVEPTAFQPYIQQLDEIIKKYQEFANAAQGNATEVANANLFLTESLKQYAVTMQNDLNDAEQQAIQNAIQLIDLEKQRYEIINQEAQQEYDILTQGVLVRQRSQAQVKGGEIAQLRYQRDQQLQQIDEEISLADYKYQTEQKIFGLASTRIDLETQLLQLQEQQADQNTAQVEALQQVLSSVQQALATGNLPSAFASGGALASGSDLLTQLEGTLGLPTSNVPSSVTQGVAQVDTNYLQYLPQQFQQDAQLLNTIYPNFLHYLIEGLTGKVPQARNTAYGQAGSAWKELQGQDPNARQFVDWIQSGTLPADTPIPPGVPSATGQLPPYEQGGPINQTGPILAHAGEYVLSKPVVNFLNSASNTVSSMVGRMGGGLLGISTPIANPISVGATPTPGTFRSTVNDPRIDVEAKVMQMTNTRTQMEMQIVSARTAQVQAEMQMIKQMHGLLDRIGNMSGGVGASTSLEGMLAKVYETRGRYGSAGFRRETI